MQINFSSQPWQVFPSAKMRDFEKEDLTFSRRPEEDFILCYERAENEMIPVEERMPREIMKD